MRLPVLVALFALVVSACGGALSGETTTTGASTTTSVSNATTTTDPGTTTTVIDPRTTTTTSIPLPLVEIASGHVSGPEQIAVALGETAEVRVLSDVDDELHVHGYDLVFDLEAGVPLDISFVADIPGVFEVEVHTGHTHVLEIRVEG